jgi:predicted Zn-ribbon and HTH transcriptional regulator
MYKGLAGINMLKDPGLFTDATGEGMAGAEDVALSTQQQLKNTVYNGSKACKACGSVMNPVQSLKDQSVCPTCNRRKAQRLLKGRMSE